MKPLNILQTISVRWWNACAYYAVLISKGLSKDNKIIFASDKHSPPFNHADQTNLNTRNINFKSLNPFNFFYNFYKVKSLINAENIQIVNAHRPEDHLLMGLVCRNTAIPLIRTVGDIRPPAENPLNKWLHLKATDFFIFTSDSNRTRFTSVWPQIENNSAVIYGGLELKEFKPREKSKKLLNRLNLKSEDKIVGFTGRLSKTKDIPTFINAAALIHDALPEVNFIISGSEKSVSIASLKEMINSLGLGKNFHILDHQESVRDLISILDIGVITSKDSEAISRIGMEYMAMGKPVVATNVNVLPEIIVDGRNGFIANTEDPFEIAQSVIKLLKNKKLYTKIVENNLKDSQMKFDLAVSVKMTIDIYKKLLDSPVVQIN